VKDGKTFLAVIGNFTYKLIWILKAVVHPETMKTKHWFIKQKE